jgi:hypothetical protein
MRYSPAADLKGLQNTITNEIRHVRAVLVIHRSARQLTCAGRQSSRGYRKSSLRPGVQLFLNILDHLRSRTKAYQQQQSKKRQRLDQHKR